MGVEWAPRSRTRPSGGRGPWSVTSGPPGSSTGSGRPGTSSGRWTRSCTSTPPWPSGPGCGSERRRAVAEANVAAVFFDLGDTLGTPVLGGRPPKLVGFDVFPFVPAVLADLKARALKLGVISNTGDEKGPAINAVLGTTGLLADLDPSLRVYSGDEPPLDDGTPVTKAIPEIFHRAAKRAGLEGTPQRALFVGESAPERQVAASAGWRTCPHP